ncbi:SDR family oxidoreductase [Komagataeibacter sp. FNDCR2]|uniref:SDR family oxidoreductase n=1 Tax=Komagataeibacter sp. FNDCR2 TaxID=2878682 RepID=UPI001E4BA67E|nr:SDR family oxidoreductase [Komagataeibacter sp. FNDCR2]MCE2574004.1 SDR family oxidoreductase [Komagataeibacter sp. FNDCR2]
MPATSKIFVTGSTGHLGNLVIDALLETLPASVIVAGVRNPSREAAIAIRNKGVDVRVADYDRPETLNSAFAGIDRLLLISSSEVGKRTTQHRNVIAAAKGAGVDQIAYTSLLHADTSPLFLAREHYETELALQEAGVPFVLLRNGWYTEVYTWRIQPALQAGVFLGASGDGRISSAAREDYARAAAVVLADGNHAGRTYELAGDASYTLPDFVATVAKISGKPLPYRNMAPEDYRQALLAAGTPEPLAMILSDTDAGVEKGALFDDSGDLARLIGRTTTPFDVTIAEFF